MSQQNEFDNYTGYEKIDSTTPKPVDTTPLSRTSRTSRTSKTRTHTNSQLSGIPSISELFTNDMYVHILSAFKCNCVLL